MTLSVNALLITNSQVKKGIILNKHIDFKTYPNVVNIKMLKKKEVHFRIKESGTTLVTATTLWGHQRSPCASLRKCHQDSEFLWQTVEEKADPSRGSGTCRGLVGRQMDTQTDRPPAAARWGV